MTTLSSFRYHNEPEGKNIMDKISSLVRLGGILGFYQASNILISDHTRKSLSFWKGVNIYAGHMVPPMAMGFTYATARYILTNVRKKNDQWNCFLAGAVNAPIVYAWLSHRMHNQPRIIVLLPVLCGFAALSLEYTYQHLNINSNVYQGSKIVPLGDRHY